MEGALGRDSTLFRGLIGLQDPIDGHSTDPHAGRDSSGPETLAFQHLDTIRIDASGPAAISGPPQRRIDHDLGDTFRLTLAAHIGFELGKYREHAEECLAR